ncbi:MAG: hypothetical protein AAGJ82_08690 [Bacteroidota bacterium]
MPNLRQNKPTFEHFITYFPAVALPFTLGEDTHMLFSKENKPLPAAIIAEYILPLEGLERTDETTEYVACFHLPMPKGFYAIVYWTAELLNYAYKLVTFDHKGNVIAEKTVAGTTFDGNELTQSMAVINEDKMIYLVSGQSQAALDDYAAANSTASRYQLTDDGKIVEL